MSVLTFPATQLSRLWGASLNELPSLCGMMGRYWPWEKIKIKGEKCPFNTFFAVAYMNRTVAPWTAWSWQGDLFICLKYTQEHSPLPKPWSGTSHCQYTHLPQGLQCEGRKKRRRWLCCFNTEGIFPREQLFDLVHWALLKTAAWNLRYRVFQVLGHSSCFVASASVLCNTESLLLSNTKSSILDLMSS